MQLTLENPDFRYFLRGASPEGVLVNEVRISRSFILSPMSLIENWRPAGIDELTAEASLSRRLAPYVAAKVSQRAVSAKGDS